MNVAVSPVLVFLGFLTDMAMLSHQYNKLTEAVEAYDKALGLYVEEAVAAAENHNNKAEGEGKTDREGVPSSAFLDVSNCLSCLGKRENDLHALRIGG